MSSEIFRTPPESTPPTPPPAPNPIEALWGRGRLFNLRWVGIAALALVLQLPILRIGGLIEERQTTQQAAIEEITGKWGGMQTLNGPVLKIPYVHAWTDTGGRERQEVRHVFVLPEALDYAAKVDPEIRKRGLFEVPVFTAEVKAVGRFDLKGLGTLAPLERVKWSEAVVLLPGASLDEAAAPVRLGWRGKSAEFEAVDAAAGFAGGLEAPAPLDAVAGEKQEARFTADLKLRGSQGLFFVPLGKTTRVRVSSPWASPSFAGSVLPKNRRVGEEGFIAEWNEFAPTRIHPARWTSERTVTPANWEKAAFGVEFAIPTDAYAKTSRSTKYSLLFIAMTFLTFYLLEMFRRSRVHLLQYALVGLALCLFYLLLLSLAEHVAFGLAYALALAAVLALTGLYTWGVFRRAADALGIAAALAVLYGYLYVVLNAEDHALLFGTLGLSCMLGAVMYATRRLNAGGDAGGGGAGEAGKTPPA